MHSTSRSDNTTRNDRGAIAAEFAIILPILVILIFAIIEFGVAFTRYQAVHGAAREGARVASIPTTTQAEACSRAIGALAGVGFDSTPTCSWSGGCGGGADRVVVTVVGQTDIDIPFFGSATYTLNGSGDFRCE